MWRNIGPSPDPVAIAKALSDETRLRALLALRRRELCLCQLIELLGLATSTVSKHMAILHEAHLVRRRKVGRWAFYRLPATDAPAAVGEALTWLRRHAAHLPLIREDARRLNDIIKRDREDLCRSQRAH